jgi:hypothetical protein
MNEVIDKLLKIKKTRLDLENDTKYKKIKTFEDACESLGISAELPIFNHVKDNNYLISHYKLCIVIQAINRGWVCDFSDSSQKKWYNGYIYSGSGLRFSNTNTHYDYAHTFIGARLCFESKEKAQHCHKYFDQLYIDYLSYINI